MYKEAWRWTADFSVHSQGHENSWPEAVPVVSICFPSASLFIFVVKKNIFIIEIYLCHKHREDRIKFNGIERKMNRILRNTAEIVSTRVLKPTFFCHRELFGIQKHNAQQLHSFSCWFAGKFPYDVGEMTCHLVTHGLPSFPLFICHLLIVTLICLKETQRWLIRYLRKQVLTKYKLSSVYNTEFFFLNTDC